MSKSCKTCKFGIVDENGELQMIELDYCIWDCEHPTWGCSELQYSDSNRTIYPLAVDIKDWGAEFDCAYYVERGK